MTRITILTILLALFGGMQVFTSSLAGPLFVGAGLVVISVAVVIMWREHLPATLLPASLILLAMNISSLVNYDIFSIGLSRQFIVAGAIAIMIMVAPVDDIWPALYRAGLLWPPIWLAATWLGWWDNRNIVAVWSVLFIIVGLKGYRWWYLAPHLLMLFWLGSRGAWLNLAVAGLVILWPGIRYSFITNRSKLAGLGALTGLTMLLAACRLDTALFRLHYWQAGLSVFLDNPFFGVGPGGISARQLITEPGGGFQVHAHNIIITTAAETGLVGLLLGGAAVWYWMRYRRAAVDRWQQAIIAGLLVHSLVDQPLWWPGPLILLAMII